MYGGYTMELTTKHFGLIEIDEKGIISFPEGIPGFEDVKKFVLLGNASQDNPFQWLQSVDKPDLAFIIIDPKVFRPDYIVDVDDNKVEILEINHIEKVLVYAIVVIPEDVRKMTANLAAPVLINTMNNLGKQVTLEKGNYMIRHYILDELERMGG
jgi:flagellar assembly factor FliW